LGARLIGLLQTAGELFAPRAAHLPEVARLQIGATGRAPRFLQAIAQQRICHRLRGKTAHRTAQLCAVG